MTNITNFTTREQVQQSDVQQDVIDDLTKLLERAKAGELVGFAYAAVMSDKSTSTGWTGWGRNDMSFGISLLNLRYHQRCLE